MSVELAARVNQLEQQIKAMQSQAEVMSAELQERGNQAVAYRTNLHITQKAFQELKAEKDALATKVHELEEKLKPHLVKEEAA